MNGREEDFPGLMPLFNRAADGTFKLPEDGWYQVVPKGRFPILDPEAAKPTVIYQVVDDRALELMLNRFNQEAKRPNFPGLLVDFDHFSYDTDKSSEAAGWLQGLQNRADGLWGQIKWTPKGEQALKDGSFRFVSPVWGKSDTEKLANTEFRPKRLETLGLTNQPNLRGMVPLSNRDRASSAGASGHPAAGENKTKSMKRVNEALGLSPDAAEEAALAEVTKLMNRSRELETENTTLKSENESLSEAQVESDLEKYKNRFKPEKREAWKNRLKADRKGAIEILEDMAPIGGETAKGGQGGQGGTPSGGKMLNRSQGSTPSTPAGGVNVAQERQQYVNGVKLRNRCTYEEAWNIARSEKPELFAATANEEADGQ